MYTSLAREAMGKIALSGDEMGSKKKTRRILRGLVHVQRAAITAK
jgi:hypothetical protein